MPPPAPSWGRTCPTATLPVADIWLTLSEPSTWPRERLRPSQRLSLRLTPLCSTGPTDSRECTTPPSTTTSTPLPTPATGTSTSLLTTTSATGSPSMARERLMLSPSTTDSRASSTTPTTPPTTPTLLPTPPTPSAPTGTSSSLLTTTEDMELSTTTELSPLTSQPATQQD